MKTLDAKGIPCPKPLILTKQTLSSMQVGDKLEILLDDEVAHKNITDFLKDNGIEFSSNGLNFTVTKNKEIKTQVSSKDDNTIVMVDKNYMGEGDKELGDLLLKAFLGTLTTISKKPKTIYLYNSAVLISKDKSYETILNDIRHAGIKLFFCGTCVKFYNIEGIDVSEQTNMLNIVESQAQASSIIRV